MERDGVEGEGPASTSAMTLARLSSDVCMCSPSSLDMVMMFMPKRLWSKTVVSHLSPSTCSCSSVRGLCVCPCCCCWCSCCCSCGCSCCCSCCPSSLPSPSIVLMGGGESVWSVFLSSRVWVSVICAVWPVPSSCCVSVCCSDGCVCAGDCVNPWSRPAALTPGPSRAVPPVRHSSNTRSGARLLAMRLLSRLQSQFYGRL